MSERNTAPDERDEESVAASNAGGEEESAPAGSAGESGASEAAQSDDEQSYYNRWLRTMADLDNLRKRTGREIEAARRRNAELILRDFLSILDNLERAIDAQDGERNAIIEGLDAIHQQMLNFLKGHGVERFDAVGETFDPRRHEAVATVDLPNKSDGQIVEVIEAGYQMTYGALLRPAKVVAVRRSPG